MWHLSNLLYQIKLLYNVRECSEWPSDGPRVPACAIPRHVFVRRWRRLTLEHWYNQCLLPVPVNIYCYKSNSIVMCTLSDTCKSILMIINANIDLIEYFIDAMISWKPLSSVAMSKKKENTFSECFRSQFLVTMYRMVSLQFWQ